MWQVVTKLGNHPDRTDHHHCVETHQLLEIGKDTQTQIKTQMTTTTVEKLIEF